MNRIRASWEDTRRATADPSVRVGASMTLMLLGCAVFMTVLASAMPSPMSWFIAGMLNAFVLTSTMSLASMVASVRKMQESDAILQASSTIIARHIVEKLKNSGLDVEVIASPEGIAVRKRAPTTKVH